MSESCKTKYIKNCKLVKGYNQLNPMPRALGFKDEFEMQCKLTGYSHLINASDVVTVCEWLFKNGYDIIKQNENEK